MSSSIEESGVAPSERKPVGIFQTYLTHGATMSLVSHVSKHQNIWNEKHAQFRNHRSVIFSWNFILGQMYEEGYKDLDYAVKSWENIRKVYLGIVMELTLSYNDRKLLRALSFMDRQTGKSGAVITEEDVSRMITIQKHFNRDMNPEESELSQEVENSDESTERNHGEEHKPNNVLEKLVTEVSKLAIELKKQRKNKASKKLILEALNTFVEQNDLKEEENRKKVAEAVAKFAKKHNKKVEKARKQASQDPKDWTDEKEMKAQRRRAFALRKLEKSLEDSADAPKKGTEDSQFAESPAVELIKSLIESFFDFKTKSEDAQDEKKTDNDNSDQKFSGQFPDFSGGILSFLTDLVIGMGGAMHEKFVNEQKEKNNDADFPEYPEESIKTVANYLLEMGKLSQKKAGNDKKQADENVDTEATTNTKAPVNPLKEIMANLFKRESNEDAETDNVGSEANSNGPFQFFDNLLKEGGPLEKMLENMQKHKKTDSNKNCSEKPADVIQTLLTPLFEMSKQFSEKSNTDQKENNDVTSPKTKTDKAEKVVVDPLISMIDSLFDSLKPRQKIEESSENSKQEGPLETMFKNLQNDKKADPSTTTTEKPSFQTVHNHIFEMSKQLSEKLMAGQKETTNTTGPATDGVTVGPLDMMMNTLLDMQERNQNLDRNTEATGTETEKADQVTVDPLQSMFGSLFDMLKPRQNVEENKENKNEKNTDASNDTTAVPLKSLFDTLLKGRNQNTEEMKEKKDETDSVKSGNPSAPTSSEKLKNLTASLLRCKLCSKDHKTYHGLTEHKALCPMSEENLAKEAKKQTRVASAAERLKKIEALRRNDNAEKIEEEASQKSIKKRIEDNKKSREAQIKSWQLTEAVEQETINAAETEGLKSKKVKWIIGDITPAKKEEEKDNVAVQIKKEVESPKTTSKTKQSTEIEKETISTDERLVTFAPYPKRCDICANIFSTESVLRGHKMHMHNIYEDEKVEKFTFIPFKSTGINKKTVATNSKPDSTSQFGCGKCDNVYSSKSVLLMHKYMAHSVYPDNDVPKISSGTTKAIEIQKETVSNSTQAVPCLTFGLPCGICQKVYSSESVLRDHKMFVHEISEEKDVQRFAKYPKDDSYKNKKIEWCPETKITVAQKEEQKKELTVADYLKEEIPNCASELNKITRRASKHGYFQNRCDICNNVYSSDSVLRYHKMYVHDISEEKEVQKTLTETFKTNESKEKTASINTEKSAIPRYLCMLCREKFATEPLLRMHRLSYHNHTEKPVIMSAEKTNCGNEKDMENKIEPFVPTSFYENQCDICKKVYSSEVVLREHKMYIHKINEEKEVKQLTEAPKFETYEKSGHRCDICNIRIDNYFALAGHKQTKHGIMPAAYYTNPRPAITGFGFGGMPKTTKQPETEAEDIKAMVKKIMLDHGATFEETPEVPVPVAQGGFPQSFSQFLVFVFPAFMITILVLFF